MQRQHILLLLFCWMPMAAFLVAFLMLFREYYWLSVSPVVGIFLAVRLLICLNAVTPV
jgi:hypothetical protein